MSQVYKKVPQVAEICYIDKSASFKLLNTSITLIYTSCAVRALLFGLLMTSDKLEVTLEKVVFISLFILFHFYFMRKMSN